VALGGCKHAPQMPFDKQPTPCSALENPRISRELGEEGEGEEKKRKVIFRLPVRSLLSMKPELSDCPPRSRCLLVLGGISFVPGESTRHRGRAASGWLVSHRSFSCCPLLRFKQRLTMHPCDAVWYGGAVSSRPSPTGLPA